MFEQEPPALGNQYDDDRVLRSYLRRVLPVEMLEEIEEDLIEMGHLSGGPLYAMQQADRMSEPELTQWDAWGNRVDRISATRVWQEAERLAAEQGVVATAYEAAHGSLSRIHQFALAYLFIPSTDIYGCPLAMTDGAARTLLASGNEALISRAVPHLTSRDPQKFWTSGQWMTELAGGSDVGRSETTARRDEDGTWRLYGRKWFTSAITSQMALALARPDTSGNPRGSAGLALFFVPVRDEEGKIKDGIRVNRLKDKLGTRKLPTAELTLDGAEAGPVGELEHGTRQIAPMLNVTRSWNAVTACAYMRRGIALARDYARKRAAFGKPLSEQPLHVDTLAGLQATFEGAFHLTFRVAELLGRAETGEASDEETILLRLMTPLAKLTTAKQTVAVASEVLEAFGGAGYIEDTGLPVLLRDVQVLPLWEGTTNVLALDVLRVLDQHGGPDALEMEIRRCTEAVTDPTLLNVAEAVEATFSHAARWIKETRPQGRDAFEAGARRLALTLGCALEAALLARHAQWALDHEEDARPAAAARRLTANGIDRIALIDGIEARALANDEPLPAHATSPA